MRTKDATWHLQRVTYIAWLVAFLAWKVVEPRPKPTCQSRILPTGNKGTVIRPALAGAISNAHGSMDAQ